MTGGPCAMIADAERRFPVRTRIAVPACGFGQRLEAMYAWLDQNCGADGWVITPAGLRGIVNDAVAIYFRNAALSAGFVTRWCHQRLPEITDGIRRPRR
jgi:hypothetical protein